MKKPITILVGILAILLVLSFAKDMLVKVSVEKGVLVVTGLPLKIRGLSIGIMNTLVGIKDLRLFNPEGYKDEIMLDMPEIYVDYDLPAVFKGKIHLQEMRIDMRQFTVVKNEKGELNLDSLKVVQAQKEGKKPQEKTAKEGGKAPDIQIDSLELKIGKVLFKDYSRSGAPSVKEFNVNLDEKYENITDPYTLVSLIVVKTLMNTTIASLTNFDLGGLQGTVSDTLASAQKIVGDAAVQAEAAVQEGARQAQEAAAQAQKEAEKALTDAQKNIQDATKGLQEKIKLPFGE